MGTSKMITSPGRSTPPTLEMSSRQRSPRTWRLLRTLSYPPTMLGLVLCVSFFSMALLAPWIAPYAPERMGVGPVFAPPSSAHPFGTDDFGRDLFSRVVIGSRISLGIGLTVMLYAGLFGTFVGIVSGYSGGLVDELLMRITDIFQAVPSLILAMTISTALGPSIENAIIGISLVRWTAYARLMRAGVLVERQKEYIEAARGLGVPALRVIWRHIFPNSYNAVLIQATLDFGAAIMLAAGLSFIGAGAQPPSPEWGALVSGGRQYVTNAWWISTFPGLCIFGVVMGFNLLGDALRDALDPRLR